MELSKRLELILNNVENSECLADIGTDHGYIPIQAIKRELAKKAIAIDINKDPLDKAKLNSIFEEADEMIEFRLGGGLSPLNKGEANVIVLAGMGGNLIKDILEDGKDKLTKETSLILLPAQNPEVLREYLYTNGFEVIKEDLCKDEDIYYEMFKIKVNEDTKTVLDSMYYELSPILIKEKHPLMAEYLEEKRAKYKKIQSLIKDEGENAISRKEEVEKNLQVIENMINFL